MGPAEEQWSSWGAVEEHPTAKVVSTSLGRASFQSVECETVAKSVKSVRPSDLQFGLDLAPKCDTFAKFAVYLIV